MQVVADSSGLISLFIDSDSNYQQALAERALLESSTIVISIPAPLLAETINILGKKFGHQTASTVARAILDSKSFLLVDTSEAIFQRTIAKFKAAPASVSFTDCIVMATADEYETKYIFGFDECFAQGGYALPGAS